MHAESTETPGDHFLLANTHLFSQPTRGHFIRFVQCIMCAQYLESLKKKLLFASDYDANISNIRIIFGGDFNMASNTPSFKYLTSKSIILNEFQPG